MSYGGRTLPDRRWRGNWERVITEEQWEGEDAFRNHGVYGVVISPKDPNVIYSIHNYWVGKSIDGGHLLKNYILLARMVPL